MDPRRLARGLGAVVFCLASGCSLQLTTPLEAQDPSPTRGGSWLPANASTPKSTPSAAPTDPNSGMQAPSSDPSSPLPTKAAPSPFVAAAGSTFLRGGKTFRLKGFQASLPGLPYCAFTADEFTTSLADMASQAGANTVRLWFFQAAGGPGNWGAFDSAIAAAKAQNLLIVATLVNQWGDCEPTVNGAKNLKTLDWYQTGYKAAQDGYPLSFRAFAQAVASRYAGEPTIAFWQLVNEAQAAAADGSCPSTAAAGLRAFADDMAQVMHSADPNHLVNLGTAADNSGHCGTLGADYTTIHQGNIDICEVHSYDPASDSLPTLIADHIAQALALKKPIFLGEVGICRNVQASGTCFGDVSAQTLQARANFMGAHVSAALSAGMAGVLIWQWSPASGQFVDSLYGMGPNDPYLAAMKTAF